MNFDLWGHPPRQLRKSFPFATLSCPLHPLTRVWYIVGACAHLVLLSLNFHIYTMRPFYPSNPKVMMAACNNFM